MVERFCTHLQLQKTALPGLFWVVPKSPPVLFVAPNAEDPKPPVAPKPVSDDIGSTKFLLCLCIVLILGSLIILHIKYFSTHINLLCCPNVDEVPNAPVPPPKGAPKDLLNILHCYRACICLHKREVLSVLE